MSDDTPTQDAGLPEDGLDNDTALQIYALVFKRWWEITNRDIEADRVALPSMDIFQQTVTRAKWFKRIDLLMETHRVFKKRYESPRGELRLVEEIFGDQLGLGSTMMPEDVKERLQRYKLRMAKDFDRTVEEAIKDHQITSPIEQVFLMEWNYLRISDRLGATLTPQHELKIDGKSYRVDFLATTATAKVVVELDGHAFHERTPAQTSNDKQRERAITRQGYRLMRFTGTEILRNPRKCVEEVAELLGAATAPS